MEIVATHTPKLLYSDVQATRHSELLSDSVDCYSRHVRSCAGPYPAKRMRRVRVTTAGQHRWAKVEKSR